jgi:2-C-methyl-D-erythritol 2,4-cyclodiphosphate synthase
MFKCAIGHDSHRFEPESLSKPLILGGVHVPGCPGLEGNSDADVVLHALTNAISGISGENVLGKVTDEMCRQGIRDSSAYVEKALGTLGTMRISHISISIEGSRPTLTPHIPAMKSTIAQLCGMQTRDIGITATTGEGLTAFGRGEGLQVFVVVSAVSE